MGISSTKFITFKMGWKKKWRTKSQEKDEGIKLGFWNKGGALQPLREKRNEIENIIKTNSFGVFGIAEANLFEHDDLTDVEIEGYKIFWDKGRKNIKRRNSRCVLYIRNDLSYKLRKDLMEDNCPEI